MDATTACRDTPYAWYDLVSLTGGDGACWVDEYSRLNEELAQIMASVGLMRRGRIGEGGEVLARAWDGIGAARIADPSVLDVAERWYLGALGYHSYCRGELDVADGQMTRAADAVARAVVARPFLLGIADEVVELSVHRARIARNDRRWNDMQAFVDTALGMREGTVPYFARPDGTAVALADVRRWLEALPLPADAHPVRPELQDPARARQSIDRFVRDVLRLPGFVIQHP